MDCSCKSNDQTSNENNTQFAKWHGVDRAAIDWQPKIDESKCIGCGLCATTCGRKVYKFNYENKKSKAINPNNCMVACQTCANLCPAGAISFVKDGDTPRDKAQRIVKETGVFKNIKTELEQRKAELSY